MIAFKFMSPSTTTTRNIGRHLLEIVQYQQRYFFILNLIYKSGSYLTLVFVRHTKLDAELAY